MPRHQITTAIERVMRKVVRIPIAGCWIFTGALNEAGYGIVGKGGRGAGNDRAHRITYEAMAGDVPPSMFVCHRCDQPACCNPHHLFVGRPVDNNRDCWAKGRGSKPPRNPHVVGEVHPGHKLKTEQVIEMRELHAKGWSCGDLARRYGVHRGHVMRIVARKRWKHVQ